MKYWVYINDKVEGPFTEDKLVTLQGFTPDTLICSEDAANSGNQEWIKASSIFEFDQVTEPPVSAQAASQQGITSQSTGVDALTSALLSKLDFLTNQLNDLQSNISNIQSKLDESIAAQKNASYEAAERVDALSAKLEEVSTLPHPVEVMSSMSSIAELPGDQPAPHSSDTVQPFDAPTSIDLDAETPAESLSGKTADDAVLSAALTSLQDKENAPAPKPKKVQVFQDLLHPENSLVEETEKKEKKENLSQNEAQKEAVLAEFSAPAANEEVVDQVIKEKEAEKIKEQQKQSLSKRLIAAGAAAASAAATFVGLKSAQSKTTPTSAKEDSPVQAQVAVSEKPVPAKPVTDENKPAPAAKPVAQKQAPVAEPIQEKPSAAGAAGQEEPAFSSEIPVLDAPEEPKPEQKPVSEVMFDPQDALAPLESSTPAVTPGAKNAQSQEDLQELVSNAPQKDSLISDKDLAEAFTEPTPSQDNSQSVEQLFGLAEVGGGEQPQPQQAQAEPAMENLPGLTSVESVDAAETTVKQQVTNPDELTEIELKEGSTYLISDFVPPASSDAIAQAYAKREGKTIPPTEKTSTDNKQTKKSDNLEIKEFVASSQQGETTKTGASIIPQETKKEEAPQEIVNKEAEATVTVSQIVLENTIKTKRGAALDIKTVPMVPEPAQSDRLQLDGFDDINTQHDLKSADVKPAGKTAKMIVGLLIALLLAGVIYGMLGVMELLPAKYNILASSEKAPQNDKDSQLDEMLGSDAMATPAAPMQAAPMSDQQEDPILLAVQGYRLSNGSALKQYIEARHPTMARDNLITWTVSNAVDPDTYSIMVKVPPEQAQGFKTSYRFNYNSVSGSLEPTTSDARNLLESINTSGRR